MLLDIMLEDSYYLSSSIMAVSKTSLMLLIQATLWVFDQDFMHLIALTMSMPNLFLRS